MKVDGVRYYIDQRWVGTYVSLRIDAAQRVFVVEDGEQPIKVLAIKGLIGESLPMEVYLEHIMQEARTQHVVGQPIGQHLRLL